MKASTPTPKPYVHQDYPKHLHHQVTDAFLVVHNPDEEAAAKERDPEWGDTPKPRVPSDEELANVPAPVAVAEPKPEPVTEPAPAAVTTTVPPLPTVNLPKLSADPVVCVSTIGATMSAATAPLVVQVT